ncbi:TCP family transcription factor [Striga asiatica]|uniref:TCP family transcription factor n=1 Tax=Striga asiatica TaxID=4170 RepID=A0A5A7Q2P8_STRAF|nr:TCP family transcription factor [Striga asiatica]
MEASQAQHSSDYTGMPEKPSSSISGAREGSKSMEAIDGTLNEAPPSSIAPPEAREVPANYQSLNLFPNLVTKALPPSPELYNLSSLHQYQYLVKNGVLPPKICPNGNRFNEKATRSRMRNGYKRGLTAHRAKRSVEPLSAS